MLQLKGSCNSYYKYNSFYFFCYRKHDNICILIVIKDSVHLLLKNNKKFIKKPMNKTYFCKINTFIALFWCKTLCSSFFVVNGTFLLYLQLWTFQSLKNKHQNNRKTKTSAECVKISLFLQPWSKNMLLFFQHFSWIAKHNFYYI